MTSSIQTTYTHASSTPHVVHVTAVGGKHRHPTTGATDCSTNTNTNTSSSEGLAAADAAGGDEGAIAWSSNALGPGESFELRFDHLGVYSARSPALPATRVRMYMCVCRLVLTDD